jgi:hypothetical protein
MTRLLHTMVVFLVAVCASAASALAQQAAFQDRGFILVNGGYQVLSQDFQTASTFRVNVEDANVTTDYEVKGGPTFDVAGGIAVWRRLIAGAGVTRFSRTTASTLNGSVPHPFFFNRPRTVTGDVAGLEHDELAVHVQLRATAPIGPRLQVAAFGGPSWFQVKQDIVTTFTWNESYPFDSATFASAVSERAKGSKLGFNAGTDIAFFLTKQLGVGGGIQYSSATVELDAAGGSQEIKAGGVNVGGGLRVRF